MKYPSKETSKADLILQKTAQVIRLLTLVKNVAPKIIGLVRKITG